MYIFTFSDPVTLKLWPSGYIYYTE